MLLVGYADEYLVAKAKEYSSDSFLVTEKNWQEFVKNKNAVGYTGLEEFHDKECFVKLLDSVEEIEYIPCQNHDIENRHYIESCLLLRNKKLILYKKPEIRNLVENLYNNKIIKKKLNYYLNLVDDRKTTNSQLWIAGCSATYGVGVKKNQRYGHLLAKKLNKSASFLAWPGTSIPWAADQILRSDIKKNDIVVWGLTNNNRYTYCINDEIHHVNAWSFKNNVNLHQHVHGKLLADAENLTYHNITSIYQVRNLCDKVGAKLLLFGLFTQFDISDFLHNIENFFQVPTLKIDIGSDNVHPGPKSHKIYTDMIYEQLSVRNWI